MASSSVAGAAHRSTRTLDGTNAVESQATLVEARALRTATVHGVPSANAFLVETLPDPAAALLRRLPKSSAIGKPLLAFVTQQADWTVLGTLGVAGEVGGAYDEVLYHQITDMTGFLMGPDGSVPHKRNLDTLRVNVEGRTHQFRTSPGSDLFALWNICLKVTRMSKRAV